jgi:hypothetical protein
MASARVLLPLLLLSVAACTGATTEDAAADDDALTSKDAQIVDYVFRAEVLARPDDDARKTITSQLLYTVGPLVAQHQANGQIGRVELAEIEEHVDGGTKRIAYSARLPVAWPKASRVAPAQDLVLPRDMSAIEAFDRKYDGVCGIREEAVELDSLWYNFDPIAPSCHLDPADVVRVSATVERDKSVSTAKYPQYDLIWKDGSFDVVSVFNSHDGSGRREEYQKFVDGAKGLLAGGAAKDNDHGPSILRDITVTGTFRVQGQDRPVTITAIEVDSLYESGPDVVARYSPLSENADLVTYVGHSVLGKNTRALANASRATPGKYQLFFFNSCDSFAYADTTLSEAHAKANGAGDPKGTKFLDVMTNVLPSYVDQESTTLLLVFKTLLDRDHPRSYAKILGGLPSDQMVVVWGEDDNTFRP